MPNIYQFSEIEILAFILVLVRMSSFVVSWPVFGAEAVPTPVKILFALVLSVIVFPAVDITQMQTQLLDQTIFWLFVREVFIGLCLGYFARLFFYSLSIAGQVISVSMGISSIQLFNPALGERASGMEQFLTVLATLFFLGINGHHIFLSGIVQSFTVVPISEQLLNLSVFNNMGIFVEQIMNIGVQLCAPVLVSILFMNLTMAVIGRTVPQINVLITSLPVNIMVGYFILIVSLPLVVWQMHDLLDISATRLFEVMKSF